MPPVSRFYGIIIYFYWQEHAPPHFHAKYNGQEISVEIASGKVVGTFPKRALGMVETWRKLHLDELKSDWEKAQNRQALDPIEPLEQIMFLHVTKAEYIGGYGLHLTFNNGESGDVDLEQELYGEMFAPLKDMEKFRAFRVDEEIDTVVWENGADFSPEFFYEKMKSQNLRVAE